MTDAKARLQALKIVRMERRVVRQSELFHRLLARLHQHMDQFMREADPVKATRLLEEARNTASGLELS